MKTTIGTLTTRGMTATIYQDGKTLTYTTTAVKNKPCTTDLIDRSISTDGDETAITGPALHALLKNGKNYKKMWATREKQRRKWIDFMTLHIADTNLEHSRGRITADHIGSEVSPLVPDTYSHKGDDYALQHIPSIRGTLVSVDLTKDRPYTIRVTANAAFRGPSFHHPANSLAGLTMTFSAVAIHNPAAVTAAPAAVKQEPEIEQDRRSNQAGRLVVTVAQFIGVSWAVMGGAVVVPGNARTFAHRQSFGRCGAKWDKVKKQWTV